MNRTVQGWRRYPAHRRKDDGSPQLQAIQEVGASRRWWSDLERCEIRVILKQRRERHTGCLHHSSACASFGALCASSGGLTVRCGDGRKAIAQPDAAPILTTPARSDARPGSGRHHHGNNRSSFVIREQTNLPPRHRSFDVIMLSQVLGHSDPQGVSTYLAEISSPLAGTGLSSTRSSSVRPDPTSRRRRLASDGKQEDAARSLSPLRGFRAQMYRSQDRLGLFKEQP